MGNGGLPGAGLNGDKMATCSRSGKSSLLFIACLILVTYCNPQLLSEEVPFGIGKWEPASLGNHRAVIRVVENADAVWVHIPWRRRDLNPEDKNIIIIHAASGQLVENVFRVHVSREYGDLIFQAQSESGDYFVYYMPYQISGKRQFPTVTYTEPQQAADQDWLRQNALIHDRSANVKRGKYPEAKVIEIQSIDEFNSFSPMEIIATGEEIEKLLQKYPKKKYLLFPEDRRFPIRMADHLPLKWIRTGPQKALKGEALRGEFYAFQMGIFACRDTIEDIRIEFDDLYNKHKKIPSSAFRCFNTGNALAVEKGKVRSLWFGVQIPDTAAPGEYQGKITLHPGKLNKGQIEIVLNVDETLIKNSGDDEPWRHSHLRWLDSNIAQDEDIVAPYTPLTREKNTLNCLGRSLSLDKYGFPQSILSRFAIEMTHLVDQEREILSSPIKMVVETEESGPLSWEGGAVNFLKQSDGVFEWRNQCAAGSVEMSSLARMEFDGCVEFQVEIHALQTMDIKDIRLEIPILKEVARYMMGMGIRGGKRPSQLYWQWDPHKYQHSAWIGDVNAGLQISLFGDNFSYPSRADYSLTRRLKVPSSWYNNGKGGCSFKEVDDQTLLICAYSGPRRVKAGENLRFHFRLLITPFKTINPLKQWGTRFFQRYNGPGLISGTTATFINLPRSCVITPYINYFFDIPDELKAYIDKAHELGLRIGLNYREREVSNHAPEIFALCSLETEILPSGPGGGFPWLQEHLGTKYISGRFVPIRKDATVLTSGSPRWINYYLEGLSWLTDNLGINGIHLDDPQFDRTTMIRIRKILDRSQDNALIDLQSSDKFNEMDGFANSANLHMEHFPYLDRTWFGKDFDYSESPDFWLIEVSGIPFGLMGEMLQGGGNIFRGMLYGITSRHSDISGNAREMWRIWDRFGIQDAKMFGYWAPTNPIRIDHEKVLVTSYVRKDKVLIIVASWADDSVSIQLQYDWEALGLDANETQLSMPPMDFIQGEYTFEEPTAQIRVRPEEGLILILQK